MLAIEGSWSLEQHSVVEEEFRDDRNHHSAGLCCGLLLVYTSENLLVAASFVEVVATDTGASTECSNAYRLPIVVASDFYLIEAEPGGTVWNALQDLSSAEYHRLNLERLGTYDKLSDQCKTLLP
jgi:hypothetical protein